MYLIVLVHLRKFGSEGMMCHGACVPHLHADGHVALRPTASPARLVAARAALRAPRNGVRHYVTCITVVRDAAFYFSDAIRLT